MLNLRRIALRVASEFTRGFSHLTDKRHIDKEMVDESDIPENAKNAFGHWFSSKAMWATNAMFAMGPDKMSALQRIKKARASLLSETENILDVADGYTDRSKYAKEMGKLKSYEFFPREGLFEDADIWGYYVHDLVSAVFYDITEKKPATSVATRVAFAWTASRQAGGLA